VRNSPLDFSAVTAETFEPYVGAAFNVTTEDGPPITVTLAEVTRHSAHPGAPRSDPFALLFHGPVSPPLVQRIHHLSHADLGEMDVFLVPVGPQPGGAQGYEAVFN
jgi:hypothetical protein